MSKNNEIKFPKISVYIVSHNYARFLDQAIESVLRQNYDNWELLLIDDGSSDKTAEIMQIYANDPRIRIFNASGIGLPSVANFALREARGEYLIRLDGDDVFDENILFVLINYIERDSELAIVFPDYYLIDEEGEIFSHERRHKVFESSHIMDTPPNGACTLIRKSVLAEIGGYREDLGAQDGFDLWSKIRKSHRALNVNLPLFYYRRHGQNLTNSSYRILAARRQIKKDAIAKDLEAFRPLLAVIPCRRNYDFIPDLWDADLNGKSLLKQKIEMCLSSSLFDKVIVTSDTNDVLTTIESFNDERLEFLERETSDTIRSRNIVNTLQKVAKKYDPNLSGLTVLCYLPTPFVTLGSLEEALCTLVFNDADSSMGVEEIKEPVFRRTPFGLKAVNPERNLRTDHDYVYREANIALAAKNKNFSTGSLLGPSTINFIVEPEESFFIDSVKKLKIAHIIDSE
ncbi:Glycosyltransferase 2-like [Candidatus Methylopumilus universalis]|uniref:glycosyltransferase family 2 protein n=1 Tax=Candidatus Methylopumilus universalis TaxID=2588536 RepID=UPI003BEF4805